MKVDDAIIVLSSATLAAIARNAYDATRFWPQRAKTHKKDKKKMPGPTCPSSSVTLDAILDEGPADAAHISTVTEILIIAGARGIDPEAGGRRERHPPSRA
jgi:hypothetical protein